MELFHNVEVKTIAEIARDLSIGEETVRRFIAATYEGPNVNGKFSYIDAVILLCTKFKSNSMYYEDQQREEIQHLIAQRKYGNALRKCMNDSNHKIK